MDLLYILLVVVAVKLPVVFCFWYIFKVIHDVPEPEVERGGEDFVIADFDPGPRKRGPHGGEPAVAAQSRRGDKGHDVAEPKPLVRA